MPRISANNITMNYEQQGTGAPLVLIPYLAADHACYAFQVAEYAKHFTCISLDLRGTGESDKPDEAYTTEVLADDVAAFMQALKIRKAHIAGVRRRCEGARRERTEWTEDTRQDQHGGTEARSFVNNSFY